jgi:N-acetylglutamate synthase-like GNAT family acetyltransferase
MVQTSYSVRTSDSRDLARIAALLQASYPVLMKTAYESVALDPALKLLTRANPGLLSSGTYHVAEAADGTLVGCGGWTHEPPGDDLPQRGVGHIRHFAVHPDWIRRGIGTAIYQLFEAGARAAGIHKFECYATFNAESFYSALGFERIAVVDVQLTQGVSLTGCHMSRQL